MTSSEFLRVLEEELALEPGAIHGDESLREVEWWDSMAALQFMALADEQLQVRVTADQLAKCKTVPDLLNILGNKTNIAA